MKGFDLYKSISFLAALFLVGILAAPTPPNSIFLPLVIDQGGITGGGPTQTAPTQTPTQTATSTKVPGPTSTPFPVATISPKDAVLLAAGDIARCGFTGAQQTSDLINGLAGTVAALGDNAYDSGLASEYTNCYDPTWGAFLTRTKPVPGNHDYITSDASGYFGYYGARSGDPSKGYYSYSLGSWHILAINSNCVQVGGCNVNSPQETWVRSDLANTTAKCVLAYWHHPYYSSGMNGGFNQMGAIWQDLLNAKAEIVLSGHDHDYERFAPQDADGSKATQGITQFVVGTGGGNFTPLTFPLQPNSITSVQNVYGVLRLLLHPTSYAWQFISVDGSYSDSGTASCH